MFTRTRTLAVVVAFSWATSAAGQVPKQLFVTVTDSSGAPVLDMRAADFDVRESALPRKITYAGAANDPLRIAFVVDSSEAVSQLLNPFRAGMRAFFEALPDQTEVALMSIGRQARARFSPTSDRKKLIDAANGFFSDGGGTAALDGVIEAYSRYLKKAEGRWPIMVLVTTDGPATGSTPEGELERFLKELQPTGIVAHAIVVSIRGNGAPTIVAMNLTQATGGSYLSIAAATGLPERMKALGDRLRMDHEKAASQYRLEYLSESKEPSRVEVGVTRAGTRISVSNRRQSK